ncbi:MAG TPA: M28 family metallopeptidase [Candidatus Polarisedimenticolia bacterium]|nr:M28 family metallopeptidase [Candidatus Polarisedimenticolia bacterium]
MTARSLGGFLGIVAASLLIPIRAADTPPSRRIGFFSTSDRTQSRGEQTFLAVPTPEQAETWLRKLTEEPHVAGTNNDRDLAQMVHDRLKEYGFKSSIVTYSVLLNYPKHVSLKLIEPVEQELSLVEPGYPRDKDSYSHDAFPAFHGYGASGKAAGQVVYANYGAAEDFKKLDEMGVAVKGRIVLVRYGKVFRGLKVYEAQKRSAAGVVIFSDPADDGYMKGDVYPEGPMRPPGAFQRGSVQFLSHGPGDPQTPGYASTPSARRLPREKLEGIPRIPSLPLSYSEAEKILRAMGGKRVPDDWQGGLPLAYHLGPGQAKLEMSVEMDYAVRPIWNVLGRLDGASEPERWVILGNHRDAWTYGAVDPNSGTASFLETARGIGEAVKGGWKPRRTILLASWDAEEYGLVGSTEWGEDLAAELATKAVAYVNLDSSVTGPDLDVEGIPSLRDLALEVAGDLQDPIRGKSVGALWRQARRAEWNDSEPICLETPDRVFAPALGALGSGSDYTVFLDHLGIASMSFSFSGSYGVYHSILDNFFWMKNFGDPDFLYHALAARFFGLLAMRLGGADVVPMRYAPYAEELEKQADILRRGAILERRKAEGAEKPPEKAPLAPDFSPILEALVAFRGSAASLDASLKGLESGGKPSPASLARLNDAVVGVERKLISQEGLTGRPWFRHVLYAPGLTTGYAAWPFPGLTQAVKDHDASLWDKEARKVLTCLKAASAAMDEASHLASEGTR